MPHQKRSKAIAQRSIEELIHHSTWYRAKKGKALQNGGVDFQPSILDTLRSNILTGLSRVTLVIGTISWGIASFFLLQAGSYFSLFTLSAIYALLLATFFAPRIRYRVRAIGLISVFFIIALNSFSLRGASGAGPLWLLTAAVLSGVLLGRVAAISSVSLGASLMLFFGFAETAGWFAFNFPRTDVYQFSLAQAADWLFLTFLATLPAVHLLEALTRTLIQESELRTATQKLNRDYDVANRALLTLNDSVSNDIRGPLRRIQLATHRIAEGVPSDQKDEIKTSQQALNEAIGRIEQVLTASQRLAQIKGEDIYRQNIDLARISTGLIRGMKSEEHRKIELITEGTMEVNADKQLVTLLLEYLISSMVSISEAEETVTLSLRRIEIEGIQYFKITTSNSQSFMPEEQFVPLYTPFNAAKNQSTGADLVLVQRIIDLHNGRLRLLSERDSQPAICFTLEETGIRG